MSDDWTAGDLALCVGGSKSPNRSPQRERPKRGAIYFVRDVLQVVIFGEVWTALEIDGPSSDWLGGAWSADAFRKIRPHTPDAEDLETIELLTGQPATVEA